MKCPNCKETNLVISERKSIEIDYCPDCRGIWLDRGELDKILERSIAEQDQNSNKGSSYSSQHSHGHHKPYKRKKSFFEELFD